MNTVRSMSDAATPPTSEEARHWIEQKGASGEIKTTTARLWAGAVTGLAQCLRDDEPGDAQFILEHVDELARRWANLHPESRSDTAKTYESRARSALGAFLSWRADPSAFKFNLRDTTPRTQTRTQKSGGRSDAVPEPSPASTPASSERLFPLGQARFVRFELPEDFVKRDVMRFACHLLTLADDFDPGDPEQSNLFSMVRQQG